MRYTKGKTPLTKRTRLNPEQLNRVLGSASEGEASKYSADGVQSLELTRRLAKAKRRAKRYALFTDQLGKRLYVASDDVGRLTFDKKEALQFFHGFDKPELKLEFFNRAFQPRLSFTTINL